MNAGRDPRDGYTADEMNAMVRGDTTPQAIIAAGWDYEDIYDGPWYVFREPRDDHRLAIKSGHFTILTVGDYFDGGGPIEKRLEWICGRVNATLSAP